jgi:hypothetical protein
VNIEWFHCTTRNSSEYTIPSSGSTPAAIANSICDALSVGTEPTWTRGSSAPSTAAAVM